MSNESMAELQAKVQSELYKNILPFWMNKTVDEQRGGFYGLVTAEGQPVPEAPRGLILITRILWTFSALHQFTNEKCYLDLADRAYRYLQEYFIDHRYGGVYWLVTPDGTVINEMKKIYGQAFAIYALSEYYAATGNDQALSLALDILTLIDRHCHDDVHRGYLEAAQRDWSATTDLQLSAVDMNEKKSMNSHLHLMEALANLLRVHPDSQVAARLKELIGCHLDHILDQATHHLRLFFDEQWNSKSEVISFGHDIEASWLLCEAAEILGSHPLLQRIRRIAVRMVETVAEEGFSTLGLLYMEKDTTGKLIRKSFDWWPQAEAVVGFLNAFEIERRPEFLNLAYRTWNAIENYFVDRENGEWFYQVSADGLPDRQRYKVGEWKCPYHNTRCCLETMKRITRLLI